MKSELDIVREINRMAGEVRPVDLMMDLAEKNMCVRFFGSLLLFLYFSCYRKVVETATAVYRRLADLEFYGSQGQFFFPQQSHHERGGCCLSAYKGRYARQLVYGGTGGNYCVFPSFCRTSLPVRPSWRHGDCSFYTQGDE